MKGIIVKIEKPIDDKLKYIMWKCSDDKTLLSEKLDIIDFLINHVGLFGDDRRLPAHLLQHELGVKEVVSRLKMDVDRVDPMTEVCFAHAVRELPDIHLLFIDFIILWVRRFLMACAVSDNPG